MIRMQSDSHQIIAETTCANSTAVTQYAKPQELGELWRDIPHSPQQDASVYVC